MKLESAEIPKSYDIVDEGKVVPMAFKRLTIRQLQLRSQAIVDKVKAENRREYLNVADLMDEPKRMAFLIASAKANAVIDQDRCTEMAKTVWCLVYTLMLASGASQETLERVYEANSDQLNDAYLYCLGIDEPAAGGQAAGFPEGQ